MYKIYLFAFTAMLSLNFNAQTNSFPTPTGNVGIGSTSSGSNLQIHGTTDYSYQLPPDRFGNPGGFANVGRTSRLSLTNNATGVGASSTDGTLLRMSVKDFHIENLEFGNLILRSSNTSLLISGAFERVFLGLTPSSLPSYSMFNVSSNENGLYIQTTMAGKYGLSIKTFASTDNAIQVFAPNGTTRNFKVTTSGEVFARKYTTTLSPIPDYVFDPLYKLMSLPELRTYLAENRHLPNVPTAKEYTETGVDLGEMNRVLLEKVEELTLYILQLEERLKALEEKP